jgi:hypothetical protein
MAMMTTTENTVEKIIEAEELRRPVVVPVKRECSNDDCGVMNARLLALYRHLLETEPPPSPLFDRLLCPFFLFPSDRWKQSAQRILIVGQEPHDWGFEAGLHYPWPYPPIWSLSEARACKQSAEALTDAYKAHTYELKSPYPPASFEIAFKLFMSIANREGDGDVISTNLFKCALSYTQDKKMRSPIFAEPHEISQILDWQRGCLMEEIRILTPTAVVFLTGPNYDFVINDEFAGAEFVAVDDRPPRQFARVVHSSLPVRSFRTHHPGYLARRKWSGWVGEIAKSCC